MAINFDALPSDKPNAIPAKGAYYATIEKAEMKSPKDPSKKDYLNLTLVLKDKDGKSSGKIFDVISESDHELIRYKVKRLIVALNIPMTGSFELKDLCKIVVGKSLIVDITKEEKEGQNPKAVVDLFTNQVYYPMSEASSVFGGTPVDPDDHPFAEIDADDALDAPQAAEDGDTY